MTTEQMDIESLCAEALQAGALDPMTLRFRVVEYDKFDGTLVGVPFDDIGFPEALEQTADLVRTRGDSHFCLQPVGFIQ
jgi:hypothetical protein